MKDREELLHELAELITTRASERELREAYYGDTYRYYSNSEFSDIDLTTLLEELK